MKHLMNKLAALKSDEHGASAIEYAVMTAILVVMIAAAIALLGTGAADDGGMGESFNNIKETMVPPTP